MTKFATRVQANLRCAIYFLLSLDWRQRLAWAFFLVTCVQTAFLIPYFVLIPNEPSNMFSGLLCAVTLVATLLCIPTDITRKASAALVVSVILAILVVLSGLFSSTPFSSSCRGFVILASGLGGFWCTRILVVSKESYLFFRNFCFLILIGMLVASIVGYLAFGEVTRFLDVNPHPVANRILLLWFAPISMVLADSLVLILAGWVALCLSYAIFFMSDLRSAMYIPAALLLIAALLKKLAPRILVILLVVMSVILLIFAAQLPPCKLDSGFESSYYRVENYFFSWHIAAQNPLLGIGLLSPRLKYLEGYDIRYPGLTKKEFCDCVERLSTSENVFLTFLADLGLLFFLIYFVSLIILLTSLLRCIIRSADTSWFNPLPIFLAICAGLLHYLVFDGLFHPQTTWFFHVLFGLIPFSVSTVEFQNHGC
jgi:hypothetical protein